jgi:hypothetical protein
MSDPDKSIYDHASGKALETVKAHADSNDLKCFFSWFCPYVSYRLAPLIAGSTSVDCSGGERRGLPVY